MRPTVAPEKGVLHNKRSHPVYIQYGSETLVVPPRGRVRNVVFSRLGRLPVNVVKLRPAK